MKKITYFYKKLSYFLKKKKNIDDDIFEKYSLEEIFTHYGTDKANSVSNQYNKNLTEIIGHGYSKFYEKHFNNFKDEKFNLLEIGTWFGASSASFVKYFRNAKIFGIDRNFKLKYKSTRLHFVYCDFRKKEDLKKLERKFYGLSFKIIIEDGSHILTHMIKNLFFFFKYLEKGGYFIIEDFNMPKKYNFLNDGKNEELFLDEIILNIKNKNFFNSKILTNEAQKYIFDNVENVFVYKGNNEDSDIVFLKKK